MNTISFYDKSNKLIKKYDTILSSHSDLKQVVDMDRCDWYTAKVTTKSRGVETKLYTFTKKS